MTIKRGCGTRVPGGVYLVTDVVNDRWALPVDSFLFDPSWIPLDKEGNAFYPKAIGVMLMENPHHPSRMDVWDWIGESYYPYFPDFWEETRRFGLSRRISAGFNFDLLSQGSQLIGFHRRGIMVGTKAMDEELGLNFQMGTAMDQCPKNISQPHHCVRYLWQLVDEQTEDTERLHTAHAPRGANEIMFYYTAAYAPYWLTKKKYKAHWVPAAMFHLPIHRIEVVKDTVERRHELPMDILDKSITDIPHELVEE